MENRYGAGYNDRPHNYAEIQEFSEKVVWRVVNRFNYPFPDIFQRPVGEDMRRVLYDNAKSMKLELSVTSETVPNLASPLDDELVYEATFSVEEKQDDSLGEALISAAYKVYEKEREEWENLRQTEESGETERAQNDEPKKYDDDDDEPEWDPLAMEMADPWLVKSYKFQRTISRMTGQYTDSYEGFSRSYELQNNNGYTLFDDSWAFDEDTERESLPEERRVDVMNDFDSILSATFTTEESKYLADTFRKVGIPAEWLADWEVAA